MRVVIAVLACFVASAAGAAGLPGEPQLWYGAEDFKPRLEERIHVVSKQLGFKEGLGWTKCFRARVGYRVALALRTVGYQLLSRGQGQTSAATGARLPTITLEDDKRHKSQAQVWKEYAERVCRESGGPGDPPSQGAVDAAYNAATVDGFWGAYGREQRDSRVLAEAYQTALALGLQRPGLAPLPVVLTGDQVAKLAAALLGGGVAIGSGLAAELPWALSLAVVP